MEDIKNLLPSDRPVPGKKNKRGYLWKLPLVLLAILLIVGGLFYQFAGRPLLALKKDAVSLQTEAQAIGAAFQAQNLDQTNQALQKTRSGFEQLKSDYRRLSWTKIIPYFGAFYQDGEHFIAAGDSLLNAGDTAVESITPYADILGFDNKDDASTVKADTAEERLKIALDTLDKIQPNMDKIASHLNQAKDAVDQVNINRYPQALFGYNFREKLLSVQTMIDSTSEVVSSTGPLIGQLKPLLGIPEEKKYLLLFQNDAELRPTGGFITAYAVISVHNGNFTPLGSFDIYGVDNRFGNRLKAPEPILNYHKNVFNWHLRDMNLSPDFAVSMDTFWNNFKLVGPSDIDGIIAVDTQVLVNILKVLGPVGVSGWGNFSAENDPRCDCPQVFYVLEEYADKPVGTFREERKAVLGPLMHSILLNVMQSPRKKWPEFFNVFLAQVEQKHLLAYFFDENLQKSIEAINAAGRIKDFDGDYLHVNDSNFAGAKSNMFIKETFTQDIEVGPDGQVSKTLTIDYKNPAPPSNCNLEAGELCLNGLYRDWVRVYVPKGSELISVEGSEIAATTYEDLGKTVFEAFYGDKAPLRPQGTAKLVFKYKLPFKVDSGQPFKMLIQKQPGTYGYENIIKFNGSEKTFELVSDQEIQL